MKQSEAKDFLPLIKAWAEGKDLQIKWGNGWETAKNLSFEEPISHYRIKPEPRVAHGWAIFPKDGGIPYVLNSCGFENTKSYKYVSFTVSEDE